MSKRKEVIAGKHERIRKLLNNLRATQPQPMLREQPWLAEVLEHDRLSRRRAGRFPSRVGPSDAASMILKHPGHDPR